MIGMPLWEHLRVESFGQGYEESKRLANLGKDGWELVGFCPHTKWAYFKRPILITEEEIVDLIKGLGKEDKKEVTGE